MNDRLHVLLRNVAIGLAVVVAVSLLYQTATEKKPPGYYDYEAGENAFEDGHYDEAYAQYLAAYRKDPDNVHALRGQARSLLMLRRYDEALALFNAAIARDPDFAPQYANRGILFDHMGQYKKALADYEHALLLDRKVAEGPNWLTRFLRNQPKAPSTIADRARYLREQLAKPESQRQLRKPEIDEKQRPYQM